MNKYRSEMHVLNLVGDKIFVGDQVRCSYNTSSGESGGCWHGDLTRITSKGVYINVGNKREKYVCFDNIEEINQTTAIS